MAGQVLALCERLDHIVLKWVLLVVHSMCLFASGRALVDKGHNVTFMSAFPPARDSIEEPGFEEVTPLGLVLYVRNFTDWDLVGARFRGEEPVPWDQALAYTYEVRAGGDHISKWHSI